MSFDDENRFENHLFYILSLNFTSYTTCWFGVSRMFQLHFYRAVLSSFFLYRLCSQIMMCKEKWTKEGEHKDEDNGVKHDRFLKTNHIIISGFSFFASKAFYV